LKKARAIERQTGGTGVTDTFDFVVVGGGSGGCTVAGRLSEDPKTSVALLDAGGKNDNWVVTTPFALVLMVVPSPKLQNRLLIVPVELSMNVTASGTGPTGTNCGSSMKRD
jgi:choline dehydrogenase-like flavoprotein